MLLKTNGRKRKRDAQLKKWIKASMLLALGLVVYATFIWEKAPETRENQGETKEGEEVLEAIYKAPKFRLKKKKGEKKAASQKEKRSEKSKKKSEKKTASKTNDQEGEEKKTASVIYHQVEPGDSLWKLSVRYYGTWRKQNVIYKANKKRIPNKNNLLAGVKLAIPHPTQGTGKKTKKTKKSKKSQRLKGKKTYKVQATDTLSSIAVDFYGKGYYWRKIWKANKSRIANPNRLREGVVLVIPKK